MRTAPAKISRFPAPWSWWVDQALPQYVKDAYSPRASWKGKPFTKDDAIFFMKGIGELSELFTEDRPKDVPAYFAHPKYRSAYLLYFLPLQAAKFSTLFEQHPLALAAALAHAHRTGSFKVLDLGAGPATASLALMLQLIDHVGGKVERLPKIEFEWVDTQEGIMRDGQGILERIFERFPGLKEKVSVKLQVMPWWDAISTRARPRGAEDYSLVLFGHVLNEFAWGDRARAERALEALARFSANRSGGGILFVEPAFKRASQTLSQVRDHLFSSGAVEPEATSLWGPCLHAGACPLAEGRDWCHFSVRTDLPGIWFKGFSRGLGSERQWLKFSYIWLAGREAPSEKMPPSFRRVISDSLALPSGASGVLLCEPEHPNKTVLRRFEKFWRGDIYDLRGNHPQVQAPEPRESDSRGERDDRPPRKAKPGRKEREEKRRLASRGPQSGQRSDGPGSRRPKKRR